MTSEGQPVGADTQQIVEAFGLGSALATIGSDVKHVVAGVGELKATMGTAVSDIGTLQRGQVKHEEQIRTLFEWKATHEAAPSPDYVTRSDFTELKLEVAAGRLTWPKVGALMGSILVGLGILGYLGADALQAAAV